MIEVAKLGRRVFDEANISLIRTQSYLKHSTTYGEEHFIKACSPRTSPEIRGQLPGPSHY